MSGGVGNRGAGSFLSSTKFGAAGFACGEGRRSLVGQSPAEFMTLAVVPHLSPSLSVDSPNAAPLASAAEASVWLQRAVRWIEVRRWCGGFGLCHWL